MQEIFHKYFIKEGGPFCNSLSLVIPAILRCGKANTALIAKEMSKANGLDFHSNDIHLSRFLQSDKFQIDDSFWRQHIKMIFDFMRESGMINGDDLIPINVDFTSNEDNFLILSASVNINDKAVMIYFSSRLYYHRKYTIDQKKMEEAFIKALRHILSKQYKYIIVADRGFGNKRFSNLCKENNFEYILRMTSNFNIKTKDEKEINIKSLNNQNIKNLDCVVKSWKEDVVFDINTSNNSTWFLLKSNPQLDGVAIYEKRFKIEKFFQDTKSSGFDIEKTKIKKYDRFKRLLFLIGLAHAIAVIVGNFLNNNRNNIKKNSALHIETILALLDWDLEHFPPSLVNPGKSLLGFCCLGGDGVGE